MGHRVKGGKTHGPAMTLFLRAQNHLSLGSTDLPEWTRAWGGAQWALTLGEGEPTEAIPESMSDALQAQ